MSILSRAVPTFLVATVLLLTACGGGSDKGADQAGLKVYKMALEGSPTNLDPVASATAYANFVVVNVYDTLYSYKYLARPYEIKPNLAAELPTISEDGLTFTIPIKQGVYFADNRAFPDGKGREVVAEDFVYSIKRHFDPANISQGAWLWEGFIEGLDEWKASGSNYAEEISGLQALDPYTIQIKLTKPYPQLTYTLAQGFAAIVPKEAVEFYGQSLATNPVGSGPFTLKSFDTSLAVLEKNPNYREDIIDIYAEGYDPEQHDQYGVKVVHGKQKPVVDRLEMNFIEERTAGWNSLTRGDEVQLYLAPVEQIPLIADQLQPDLVLKPEYAEKYHQLAIVETGLVHVFFNMQDPEIGYNEDPVRNERNKTLRCAVRMGFDWDKRNERFYAGIGSIFPGAIPPAVPEYSDDFDKKGIEYNPEKARKMLADAGWNADNLPTLKYGSSSSVLNRQFYEQFRGFMVNIGFPPEKVEFDDYPTFGDFSRAMSQSKVMLMSLGWGLDYPDAQNTLQMYYGPNASPGANNSNFNNPEFNRIYEQTVAMNPSPERTELYHQLNQIIIDECPSITGLSRRKVFMWHRDVLGFWDFGIVGGFHLPYVDIAEPTAAQ